MKMLYVLLALICGSTFPASANDGSGKKEPHQLSPAEDFLARHRHMLGFGHCLPESAPGDVCAEGICQGCGIDGTHTVYRCDAERDCQYSGEEQCNGSNCPVPQYKLAVPAQKSTLA